MKQILIAALLAVSLSPAVHAQEPPTWQARIDPKGWTPVQVNTDLVVFTKPAPADPQTGYRRRWARAEGEPGRYKQPSSVALYEFDCDAGRSRRARVVRYAEQNMLGASAEDAEMPGPWTIPVPGSFDEGQMARACE